MSVQADIITALVASLDAVAWTSTAATVTVESKNYPESEIEDLADPLIWITDGSVESERIMRIGRAIAHMERHFDEGVTLPDLAKMVGMSGRSFYRSFSMATGESPLAYLQKLRLAKAAKILQTTDKNVTEVAFECGFNDSSYFARQFRRVFGASPLQFQAAKRLRNRGRK